MTDETHSPEVLAKANPVALAAFRAARKGKAATPAAKPEAEPPQANLGALSPPLSSKRQPSQPEAEIASTVESRELAASPTEEERATLSELVQHCALDSVFFCKHFFPKAFRQDAPAFHRDIWALLDDPDARYVNIQVMRGGAKTTLLRAYMAKRIAYGLSRTILYIGASEKKAHSSIDWIKRQVLYNRPFAQTFGLSAGKPWTNEEARINHGTEGHSVTVMALGITGSVRGINIDDHRPDLIINDDVIKDDNAATDMQRLKINELIMGAVKESLAPPSEVPDAKMVIINTPQDFEDLSQLALKDPQFRSARFGCWTAETENLPLELQESSWPARWTSDYWRSEKRAAIARNMLSTFARENECSLITPETSSFRAEWLQYFGPGESEPEPPRHETWVEIVVDPVPPPSEIQIAKGLVGKDFEAITAVGRWRNKYYVLETVYNRGHQPNWTVAELFQMCNRWKPRKIIVESVAYQRTLAWLIREGMKTTGRYYPVEEFVDKRKKLDRIKDGLSGPAANGALFIRRTQQTLISQFIHFPGKNPDGTHDDVLETVAIGVTSLSKGAVGDIMVDDYAYSEKEIPRLEYARGAP